MNLPNSLTILRILLIPVFIGFLLYERYEYSLAVLLLAGLTDGLDGTIARVANQRTRLGAYLDPVADKLLLISWFASPSCPASTTSTVGLRGSAPVRYSPLARFVLRVKPPFFSLQSIAIKVDKLRVIQ